MGITANINHNVSVTYYSFLSHTIRHMHQHAPLTSRHTMYRMSPHICSTNEIRHIWTMRRVCLNENNHETSIIIRGARLLVKQRFVSMNVLFCSQFVSEMRNEPIVGSAECYIINILHISDLQSNREETSWISRTVLEIALPFVTHFVAISTRWCVQWWSIDFAYGNTHNGQDLWFVDAFSNPVQISVNAIYDVRYIFALFSTAGFIEKSGSRGCS